MKRLLTLCALTSSIIYAFPNIEGTYEQELTGIHSTNTRINHFDGHIELHPEKGPVKECHITQEGSFFTISYDHSSDEAIIFHGHGNKQTETLFCTFDDAVHEADSHGHHFVCTDADEPVNIHGVVHPDHSIDYIYSEPGFIDPAHPEHKTPFSLSKNHLTKKS